MADFRVYGSSRTTNVSRTPIEPKVRASTIRQDQFGEQVTRLPSHEQVPSELLANQQLRLLGLSREQLAGTMLLDVVIENQDLTFRRMNGRLVAELPANNEPTRAPLAMLACMRDLVDLRRFEAAAAMVDTIFAEFGSKAADLWTGAKVPIEHVGNIPREDYQRPMWLRDIYNKVCKRYKVEALGLMLNASKLKAVFCLALLRSENDALEVRPKPKWISFDRAQALRIILPELGPEASRERDIFEIYASLNVLQPCVEERKERPLPVPPLRRVAPSAAASPHV